MVVYNSGTAKINNFTATIHSRPLYVSSNKEKFAEVFRVLVFCEFDDTEDFDVWIYADGNRYKCECNYSQTAETELTSGQIPTFRNVIEIVPPEGFTGQFFEIRIEKVIPDDGEVIFRGNDVKVIQRGELSPEFVSGSNAIQYGWA